jgi:hypothetical protein
MAQRPLIVIVPSPAPFLYFYYLAETVISFLFTRLIAPNFYELTYLICGTIKRSVSLLIEQ